MGLNIRLVENDDIAAILNIYSYYIQNTIVTFETSVPALSDFENRIECITEKYPWLICEENGEITGYAYACEHRARDAYKWSVDVSVYLKQDCVGKGMGKRLYSNLLNIIERQGFINAYAGIALPNNASIGLHEFFGFKKIAQYEHVGFKGQWIDVGWWWKEISKPLGNPIEPIKITDFEHSKIIE
jgi:phosphinothricin acetyltransferase